LQAFIKPVIKLMVFSSIAIFTRDD